MNRNASDAAATPAARLSLLVSVILLLVAFAVADSSGVTSSTCERDGTCHTSDGDDHNDDETEELLRQISFAQRAGIHPVTIVTSIPNSGLGVVYAGSETLPPGTTVGLYRALLVRTDVWTGWLDDGTVNSGAWDDFWRAYSVEFTGEEEEEAGLKTDGEVQSTELDGNEEEEFERRHRRRETWIAIPAGDVDGSIDGPTWWSHGPLSDDSLQKATEAINARVLVDWRRLAGNGDGGGFLLFNAHMINEPSPGDAASGGDEEDEVENVGHLFGSDCRAFRKEEEGREENLKWCGAAFSARTSRTVHQGEQLLWCYGGTYQREYPVASACLQK